MTTRLAQANMTKGEIGPHLYGRFDVPAYQAGLKRARNVIVMKYGGVTKRPGTRFVSEVRDAEHDVRLIPFQFSLDQAYVLEFGYRYMRPAALGGMVVEQELAITGITNAQNARVTAANHGYVAGDDVRITRVTGMVEVNNRTFRVVSVQNDNQFTIDVDTREYAPFVSATGGINRTEPPAPPPVEEPEEPETLPPAPPPRTGGGGYEPPNTLNGLPGGPEIV